MIRLRRTSNIISYLKELPLCLLLTLSIPIRAQSNFSEQYITSLSDARQAAGLLIEKALKESESSNDFIANLVGASDESTDTLLSQALLTSIPIFLVERFEDIEPGLHFIDSLLLTKNISKNAPFYQSLLLGKVNLLISLDKGDLITNLTDQLKEAIDNDSLILLSSDLYFVLSSLLVETNNLDYAARALEICAERYQNDDYIFWRTHFHLAINSMAAQDYNNALKNLNVISATDTMMLDSFMISQYYVVGSAAYLALDSFQLAYNWAQYAENWQPYQYKITTGYILISLCGAGQNLQHIAEQEHCNKLLILADDEHQYPAIRREAYLTLLEYASEFNQPLHEQSELYNKWAALSDGSNLLMNEQKKAILKIKNRLNISKLENARYSADLDSLILTYENQANLEMIKISKDLAEKYKTRIRRDSITNLSFQNEQIQKLANNRAGLLLLACLFALLLLVGLLRFRKLNKILLELNLEISSQNEKISILNKEINHRATNNLTQVIRLLRDQRDRAIAHGADTSVADAIERQILAYTKLQHLLKTDLTEVDFEHYLTSFCEGLRESFSAGGQPVQFDLKLAPVDVHPDFAAPLALIINELATNSLKYAQREDGVLKLSLETKLEEGNELRIQYRDGGEAVVGEINHHSSNQGMELIKGFTWELEGALIKYGNDTFDYEAVFPLAV